MKKIILQYDAKECYDSDYDFIRETYIIFECGKYFLVNESYLEHYKNHSTRLHQCNKTEVPNILGELAEKYINSNKENEAVKITPQMGCYIAIVDVCEKIKSDDKDLLEDLNELKICFSNQAYRASLALSGRILEYVLKKGLIQHNIEYDENWMIGRLLKLYEENELYLDPGLKNVMNIINHQRIVGVHVKEKVPIPSIEQTMAVIFALIDLINRSF